MTGYQQESGYLDTLCFFIDVPNLVYSLSSVMFAAFSLKGSFAPF
jgi:hypothetical protein